VKLKPTIPPGRPNRKARAFSAEITRLIKDGYGCTAIHKALTDAGVAVSKSTVQREVARAGGRLASSGPASAGASERSTGLASAPAWPTPSRSHPGTDASASNTAALVTIDPGDRRSSKDIAAAFADELITNPLILAKEKR
jgi:hypothetical protein